MKVDNFMEFVEARIAKCKERADALERDHRKDEAVFEKVQENVYDIFRSVWRVAGQQCGEDKAARIQFFQIRLEQIPSSWVDSLEKARQHGDENKALIESLKLRVIKEITLAFEQYREENT